MFASATAGASPTTSAAQPSGWLSSNDQFIRMGAEHAMEPDRSQKSEGMCSAILEAMALEVPVICRNIPGNAAIVNDKVVGTLTSKV